MVLIYNATQLLNEWLWEDNYVFSNIIKLLDLLINNSNLKSMLYSTSYIYRHTLLKTWCINDILLHIVAYINSLT